MLHDSDPSRRFAAVSPNGTLEVDAVVAQKILAQCASFNRKLAHTVFFTAGQTPRITGFAEYLVHNSHRG